MKKITFIYLMILAFSWQSQAQYLTEGFETAVPPAGWTATITNGNDPTFTWNQVANPHSGISSAEVQWDPALVPQNETITTPVLDLTSATTPRLKFWFNMSYFWGVDPNDNYDFTVSITDGATTTQLWEEADFGVFENFVWYEITIDLTAYAGSNDQQLTFNYTGSDGASLTLDDILVEETPACEDPNTLTAADVTVDSADLGWTEVGTAALWNVELGIAGFTPTETATDTGVSNPFMATGLTSGTDYEFYVQSDCDTNGTSGWVGPFAFTTLNLPPANDLFADAIAITCGETVLGTTDAAGIDEVGAPDVTTIEVDTPADNDSPNVWYSFMGTGDTVTLSTCNAGSNFDTEIMVFTGSTGALTLIDDGYDECGNPDFFAETIFTSIAATQYYISIEGWNVDDIGEFELTVTCSTCVAPSAGNATAISATTADLGWTENGTAALWNVELGAAGFTPSGTATDSGVSNPFMATGLTAETDYEFYVQSDCDTDGTSEWSGPFAFTTNALPPANDDLINAEPIVCDMNYIGSTTLATLDEDAAPDGGGADLDAPNVWYSYDSLVEGPGEITLNFCTSTYDTSVLVYTGTTGNLAFVAGNDDNNAACGGCCQSFLTFVADGTSFYLITVEGFNPGSIGDYVMDVTCVPVVPAPPNDECVNAEALTFATPTTGTTAGATFTPGEEQPSCEPFDPVADVWYSVDITAGTSDLSIITTPIAPSDQAYIAVYSVCGGLELDELDCEGTAGPTSLDLPSLDNGTYFIRIWSDGNASRSSQRVEGEFTIVVDASLSTEDFENGFAFTFYPNPVKGSLLLSAQKDIQNIAVYNMLGQIVLNESPNNVNTEVNMSELQSGAYFVKVTIEDVTETIRIIKN